MDLLKLRYNFKTEAEMIIDKAQNDCKNIKEKIN